MSGPAARIERLHPDVVNRIAAGEVIHRPANALKELLENSLDAGATQISITASQGGLKMLQIQDNGKGIHLGDLPIVCERFTTSKLRTFDDLREISSFGFRGEALASISHVAHVSITSKTADQPCAYKAHYRDGKIVAKTPGGATDPVPCAGKVGTQILVEDLFYNLSTRRQAFKNTSEQYQRILEVVQRYAVHYGDRGVGFVCKKHRDPSCDANTLSIRSQLDVIRQLYGSKLANELVEFRHEHLPSPPHRDLEFIVHAWVSNANFSVKATNFILFINERLVESAPLKRACDYLYSLYLPKHTHPFIYMSLTMPAHNLDVNVHPTKREVHFLYEEVIIETISRELEKLLKGSNVSRVFVVQPITTMMVQSELKGVKAKNGKGITTVKQRAVESDEEEEDEEDEEEEVSASDGEDVKGKNQEVITSQSVEINLSHKTTPESKKYHPSKAPQKLVRTDHRSNTIDKYYFLESQRGSQFSQSQGQSNVPGDDEREEDSHHDNAESPPQRAVSESEWSARDLSESVLSNGVASAALRGKKRRLSDISAIGSVQDEPEAEDSAPTTPDRNSDRQQSMVSATQSPQPMLTSVENLLRQIQNRKSKALEKMFREHTFVGVVNRQYSLIQYRTKLYLVRHRDVAHHLFYERVLQQFAQFRVFQLPTPIAVYELVFEALGNPRSGYDEEDGPKDQLADDMKQLLVSNGPMLAEYFGLDIDAHGMLRTLPRVLGDHEPSLHSLPEFVFHLATDVNWEEEEACFDNVAQVVAQWYSDLWYPTRVERSALVLEHVIFPATKQSGASGLQFSPPNDLNDSTILRPIACLTKLYKIFERC